MQKYNPAEIEEKWQKKWEKDADLNRARNESKLPKRYILDMFPYPSGDGLHVGHVESYTATDIMARYLRMNGFNVLHPQGWDAFGLPAENFAIKTGTHPTETTKKAIANFTRQIKSMGFSYDWSREINTSSPEYYKWTQWFFLLLYKNGLAFKKKAKVNWCESCKTVLANEQVEDGRCERCKSEVIQKDLEQWFFKITDFIENQEKTSGLIDGLDKIDWPESTKIAQRNWIGKSEGAIVKFKITGSEKFIEVFTTRVDTIFGCTYCVVAPEHQVISDLKSQISNFSEVEKYLEEAKRKTDLDRMEAKEKTGVELKGIKVVNPFNDVEVPLFAADYVLSQYGTGAVMAVPAHDERDFEFAKKYNLEIRQSIAPLFIELQGKDAVRGDSETSRRKTVIAIVKHWSEDKYFCLDWKKFGWRTFVVGGVEDGETGERAAIREVKEETGYQEIKKVTQLGGGAHSNFFAEHKGVNRYANAECFLIELGGKRHVEPDPKHIQNHVGNWVNGSELDKYVNLNIHQWYCGVLKNGEAATTDDGVLVNSGEYTDLKSAEAREKMTTWLDKKNLGSKKINYRLRDWLVSRQRYWGAPIPIIYCDKCGEVPVLEKDLPVVLPTDVDFKPTGESPLVYSKVFHDVKCPSCGAEARRESDTMDTFVCSSWYYLRYSDPQNTQEFASKTSLEKWLPVDLYVGGAEHSVLHLLYARFFTKVLHKFGYVNFDEPFQKMRHQGIILAEDGRKMSKSLGNVINPDDVVSEFGADALRMFEMFMGPLEDMKPWNTQGIVGLGRFLEKVWKLQEKTYSQQSITNNKIQVLLHKTIKKIGEDIEGFKFNTAISQLMILVNALEKEEKLSIESYQLLVLLLAPFAPHICEELWEKLGHKESIFRSAWPKHDPKLLKSEEAEVVVQVNGKVRAKLVLALDVTEDEAKETALENENVKKHLEGAKIKKVVYVPGKIISIVA